MTRSLVLQVASGWYGTPFHDNASVCNVGCDCVGFIFGVLRDSLFEVGKYPDYSPQHMLHSRDEYFVRELIERGAEEIKEEKVEAGDIILYRVGKTYAHGAIVVKWPTAIMHAVKGRGVIITHGTEEAILKGRKRRFFNPYGRP